jgi:hypothetical protein
VLAYQALAWSRGHTPTAPFKDQRPLLPTFYWRVDGGAALMSPTHDAGGPEQKLLKAERALAARIVDAKKGAL